ncbi:MAG: DUF2853 family protein [Bacteroidota bacterium]|nr:DUF2853 family protein [Bacteroidota bacterium]
MSKRQEYIDKYAKDLKEKLNVEVDLDFLTKVVVGLGPSIYRLDSETVAGSDQSEIDRVKANFLIKKLGLKDSEELDKAIAEVIEKYGKSNKAKYRAVIYYMLAKHFKKESVYNK